MRQIALAKNLRAIFFQLFAEAPHLLRLKQIGNEQIAAFADLMADRVVVEMNAEMCERLAPAARVMVIRIDERAVDIEEESLEMHGCQVAELPGCQVLQIETQQPHSNPARIISEVLQ